MKMKMDETLRRSERTFSESARLPLKSVEIRDHLVSSLDGLSDVRKNLGVHPRRVDFGSSRSILRKEEEGRVNESRVEGRREGEMDHEQL